MFTLMRALTYATLFVGLLLVLLPAQILRWGGVMRPATAGPLQFAGAAFAVLGAGLAAWCILTFVSLGRGTPAPFDPPRRLVVRGPYRFLRNPMYLGAGLALAGAAVFVGSLPLLAYALVFVVVSDQFVRRYEEPTLRRNFGAEYEAYCRAVRRWLPGRAGA